MKKLGVLLLLLLFAVPASATTSRILAPMDWWPVWSPDGSRVAFTRVYPNHMEIYSLDLHTLRSVRLGTNAGQLGPTWSSSGAQLAYSSGGVLWIANADGSAKHRYLAPTRAFAPAWQPGTAKLAYLTTHGAQNTDLWVAGKLWARNAIGQPAWSPDGKQLAFQRDDGVYMTRGPGDETRAASIANPGAASWSHDGTRLAYAVGSVAFVVTVNGSSSPIAVANGLPGIGRASWAPDDVHVMLPFVRGVTIVRAAGGDGQGRFVRGAAGPGASYAPRSSAIIASGALGSCPGHLGLAEFTSDHPHTLTGSCLITGTSKADVIEGTLLWGDVIQGLAGNDQIHASDGHTDTVDCGPGRDTVWADRTDKLTGCEIVHR
jgi:hypothetical protein